jgi:MFS transporter, PPP family, 3-phenylpropionic acid transporter
MLMAGAMQADELDGGAGVRPPRLALKTSALYAALYLHYGFFLLIPLYLSSKGAAPAEIGLLMAIPLILRLVTVAPIANWAGKHRHVRSGIAISAGAAAILVALLSQADSAAQRFAIVVVFSVVWDQIPVLVDAYASMAVRAAGLDFGRLRVWGSIGVVVSTAAAGWTVTQTGIGSVPILIAALLLLTPAVAMILPGDRRLAANEADARGSWRDLFGDRTLIGAMIAASCIMGSHGVVNSFGAIQWAAGGISTTQIGFLNSVAIASEIVVFTFGGALLGGRDPRILILFAAVAAAIRWAIMATDPSLPVLYVAQGLQGLSATGPLLAPMMMIARRVPAHLAASAQGLNAVFIGAILAGVTALSGLIWSAGPGTAYAVMIGVSLLALPLLINRSRPVAPEARPGE